MNTLDLTAAYLGNTAITAMYFSGSLVWPKTPIAPIDVTSNLVLYLDASNTQSYSGTGNTWFDLTPSVNNGTLINGPTFNSANSGSLVFDGIDDYVDLGSNSITKPTGSMTLNYWFKGLSSNQNFATGVGTTGFAGQRGYVLGPEGSTGTQITFFIAVDNTAARLVDFNVAINPNIWYYISGVFSSSNYLKLFLNGVEVAQTTTAIPATQFTGNGISLKVGRRGDDYSFSGSIAQVSLYHRALTSAEILYNFNTSKNKYGL